MTESDYIEASNLARLRIAASILRDVTPGYGPTSQKRLAEITRPLSLLIDESFAAVNTLDEEKKND